MPNNSDFDKIIPGISLVPDIELHDFFQTEEGNNIESILNNFKNRHNQYTGFQDNIGLRFSRRINEIRHSQTLVEADPGVGRLKKLIYKSLLKKYISKFILIDLVGQDILINKPYTKELYDSFCVAEQPIDQCVASWRNSFNMDPEEDLVTVLEQTHAKQLEVIRDTKEKIGFLFNVTLYREEELDTLYYAIAMELYFSNTNHSTKKKLLTEEFEKYLKHYKKYGNTNNFPALRTIFSCLLTGIMQHKNIKKTKEQIDRIANVHLLFGILGLREPAGWMLEGMDIYNYIALKDDVANLKTVLFAFAKPVRPFFMEYVQIAQLEKNPLIFLLRATMPILIMTTCVAFAFSLMVPFAMHAIIEIIMLIPTLYISMVLASYYVDLKNKAFEALIIYWRGSKYEQDAFKTNDRILRGFSNDATIAELVCNYYVTCFTDLDAIVSSLSKKFERGLLTDEEIVYYEELLKREALLKMEWYDIHDNHSLGIDNMKILVAKRLNQDARHAFQAIHIDGHIYIEKFIETLEQHLKRCQNTENNPEPTVRAAFRGHMQWSMFKPGESLTHLAKKCVSQQRTIKLIEKLEPIMELRQNILPVVLT